MPHQKHRYDVPSELPPGLVRTASEAELYLTFFHLDFSVLLLKMNCNLPFSHHALSIYLAASNFKIIWIMSRLIYI